ncbi:MAG: hypothetical protein WD075_05295 [Rhodospirillales bacterium]
MQGCFLDGATPERRIVVQDPGINISKLEAVEVIEKPLQLVFKARLIAVRVLPVLFPGITNQRVMEGRIGYRAEMLFHETFLHPFCRHRFG